VDAAVAVDEEPVVFSVVAEVACELVVVDESDGVPDDEETLCEES